MSEISLSVPTVHMNGTSKMELLDRALDAHQGLKSALHALRLMHPNGRDYYPRGHDAITGALREHRDRMARLEAIIAEVDLIAQHIAGVR